MVGLIVVVLGGIAVVINNLALAMSQTSSANVAGAIQGPGEIMSRPKLVSLERNGRGAIQ